MKTATFNENRTFGVEIEFYCRSVSEVVMAIRNTGVAVNTEHYNHNTPQGSWKIVSDGSVRGGNRFTDTGELVSPPLKGLAGLEEVKKVMQAMERAGAKVNKSCGFHVHWHVADFSGEDILDLLALYVKFEDTIDHLVAPSRRGNNNQFCNSLKALGGFSWVSGLASRGNSANDIAYVFSGFTRGRSHSRYRKVNVNSFFLYNTIEFRQHQGTVDWEKAVNWIVFTQCLVERAKQGSRVKLQESAKQTLGELFRTLKVCDHHTSDPTIKAMREFTKKRWTYFSSTDVRE